MSRLYATDDWGRPLPPSPRIGAEVDIRSVHWASLDGPFDPAPTEDPPMPRGPDPFLYRKPLAPPRCRLWLQDWLRYS